MRSQKIFNLIGFRSFMAGSLCLGAAALSAYGIAGAGSLPYQHPGDTERVSVASDGTEGAGLFGFSSELPALSTDGRYVVFDSIADNLVPNDANGTQYDVFLRDRWTGVTKQVSVSSDGQGGNQASFGARISGDGRYVVFESVADNLTSDDANGGVRDIFLHDNVTGQTTLISKSIDGLAGDEDSYAAVISRDGRFIAFDSDAANLVPGDTNNISDVFVYDRQTGGLERVSVDSNGAQADGFSGYPSLSGDGRYVAFNSKATNLSPNTAGYYEVYRHDRITGETLLVSRRTDGQNGNGSSYGSAISDDGTRVAFESDASNLVPQDDNGISDIFVRDIMAGTTKRVSVNGAGVESNGFSSFARISGDGRYVAFQSDATNLVPNDGDGARDIFVYDLTTDAMEMASVASDGSQSIFPPSDDEFIKQYVWHPVISGDGRFISWDSTANNLVPGDTNDASDIFGRDRGPSLGIGKLLVGLSGDAASISGWAAFAGGRISQSVDPSNDGINDASTLGGEITETAIIYRPEQGNLLFALQLLTLPESPSNGIPCTNALGCPPGVAGVAGSMYVFHFTSGSTSYEVRAFRSGLSDDPPAIPLFALYRCEISCTELASLEGSIGSTGSEVLISLPLSLLNSASASDLTGVTAYSAIGDAATGPLQVLDNTDLPDAQIPSTEVQVGVAPLGTPLSEVVFNIPANLDQGRFSASASLPTGSGIWARACLGQVCGPPVAWPLTALVSRKVHGGAGTYDIDLANNAIECRSGGAGGDYTLVFSFASALNSVGGASVSDGTGSIASGQIDSSNGHNYVVNLTGVSNAQSVTVSLSNVQDAAGNFSATVSASMRVLVGDTNGDGAVNSADIAQTKSQSGNPVSGSNFREDVTIDGNLNSADIGLVKSKSGTALP